MSFAVYSSKRSDYLEHNAPDTRFELEIHGTVCVVRASTEKAIVGVWSTEAVGDVSLHPERCVAEEGDG